MLAVASNTAHGVRGKTVSGIYAGLPGLFDLNVPSFAFALTTVMPLHASLAVLCYCLFCNEAIVAAVRYAECHFTRCGIGAVRKSRPIKLQNSSQRH